MSNQDNSPADKDRQRDLLLAKLALAATERPQNIGSCLSAADLNNLVENRLKDPEKEVLLRHVNGCADCYQAWYAAISCKKRPGGEAPKSAGVRLTPEQKAKVAELAGLMAGPPSIRDTLINFMKAPKKLITATVTAAACLLTLFLVMPMIDGDIPTASVAALMEQYLSRHPPLSRQEFDQLLALPWEAEPAYYGFGPASADGPRQIAFGAGLWEGRRRLTAARAAEKLPDFLSSKISAGGEPDAWIKTGDKYYYQLGQWCALLKVVCTGEPADISAKLWRGVTRTAEHLLEYFNTAAQNGEDAAIAARKIEQILTLLRSDDGGRPSHRRCVTIDSEIERLVTALAPVP